MNETHRKDMRRIGDFLLLVAMLLIVLGVRFLDANEMSLKANLALIPLLCGLTAGFTGLWFWVMSDRLAKQSSRCGR